MDREKNSHAVGAEQAVRRTGRSPDRDSSGSGIPLGALAQWGRPKEPVPDGPPETATDLIWPRIPGYEIRSRIGGSGQGDVYLARDCELQADVAIKVPRSLAAEAQEQFLREARALAKVRHRNIVAVKRFARCDECIYFVMDYVDGPDAGQLVQRFGQAKAHRLGGAKILELAGVDASQAVPQLRAQTESKQAYYRIVATWIAEAADALEAAHAEGIYHRDIKPSNLLLMRDGRLMVADFGLARSTEQFLHGGTSGVTGTYPYIAPERTSGERPVEDRRADIWALGATLYEFLCYQRAYLGRGREVLNEIASRDPVPPRRILRAVPRSLERICLKAMARDPSQRYQTARELAADLRAWAAPVPRRTRPLLVAAGCVAMALAGVFLYLQAQSPIAGTVAPGSAATAHAGAGRAAGESELAKVHAAVVPPAAGPQAAEPGPAGAASEPARAAEAAAAAEPAGPAAVFVAVSEDLNTQDAEPARAGGAVQARLTDAFERAGHQVVPAARIAEDWTEDSAWEAAAAAGADVLLFATVRATPAEPSPLATGVMQQRWDVRVRLRALRIADGVAVFDRELRDTVARAPEGLFGGEQVLQMAGSISADLLGRLHAETPKRAAMGPAEAAP